MTIVTQLINSRGNPAANQFCLDEGNCKVFQSYLSRVAKIENGKIFLSPDWDYSATTLKHLKIFLGVSWSKADFLKKIKSGELTLVDKV